jgi:N-acetylneuraminic acid mutarotase
MIVWGGASNTTAYADGGRYDPSENRWTALPASGLTGRAHHTAIWTGSQMIVWGGLSPLGDHFNDGGRFSPTGSNWVATSTVNAPGGRYDHTAVWTGSEMIVCGGTSSTNLNDGGRYSPTANTWGPMPTANGPGALAGHIASWTGSEMIVWGGAGGGDTFSYTVPRGLYLYQRP